MSVAPPRIARPATHETGLPATAAGVHLACVPGSPGRTGRAEAGGCPCPPCPPPAALEAAGSSFTCGQGHPPSSAGGSGGVRRSPCDTAAGQGRRVPSHASQGGGPGEARPGGHGVGGYPPALASSVLERGNRLAADRIERPQRAARRRRRTGFHFRPARCAAGPGRGRSPRPAASPRAGVPARRASPGRWPSAHRRRRPHRRWRSRRGPSRAGR